MDPSRGGQFDLGPDMTSTHHPATSSHAAPVRLLKRDLRIAFYGDDFTGSTDTLATLADAGARTMLFLGVPTQEQLAAAGPLDALGIAGAARSMSPSAMREE